VLTADDPSVLAESSEAVSLALLTALETLTPPQRAALLLHDVFDYDYSQIAAVLDVTAANARQLVTRARRLVSAGPRFIPERGQHAELVQRFLAAAERGDLAGLEQLLADDVVLHGDGGGKVPAIARAMHGRARVARTLRAGFARLHKLDFALRRQEVNGQPGALFLDRDGGVMGVMVLDIAEGRIQSLSSVVNPDKLQHLGRVADLRALLRR
jgi:RNA polymerase sigma-70 factor (ECF subfamily)